jgi:hypothetical protein
VQGATKPAGAATTRIAGWSGSTRRYAVLGTLMPLCFLGSLVADEGLDPGATLAVGPSLGLPLLLLLHERHAPRLG